MAENDAPPDPTPPATPWWYDGAQVTKILSILLLIVTSIIGAFRSNQAAERSAAAVEQSQINAKSVESVHDDVKEVKKSAGALMAKQP